MGLAKKTRWLLQTLAGVTLNCWLLVSASYAQAAQRPSNTKIALTYIGVGILIALPLFLVCRSSRR